MAEVDKYILFNENNEVVNIIMYDGEAEFNLSNGFLLEIHPRDEDGNYVFVDIGSIKNLDGSYTHPDRFPSTE